MEAKLNEPEAAKMLVVEIYETGEKKLISAKQIAKNTSRLSKSIIMTAAEYRSYWTDVVLKQNFNIVATS